MWRVVILLVLGMVAGMLLTPATAQADFGIDPGKVFIDNLFPGAQADVPITVYNQNDHETTFVIRARVPDYTEEGYEALSYLGWVTITPERLTIAAGGQADALVVVKMPEDADYSGKKAEMWISFMEEATSGFVKIELASRLLISTRTEVEDKTTPDEDKAPPEVQGSGKVGITAEAEKGEPTPPPSPSPSPTPTPSPLTSPVVIILSALGVILVGGTALVLVKRRRRA